MQKLAVLTMPYIFLACRKDVAADVKSSLHLYTAEEWNEAWIGLEPLASIQGGPRPSDSRRQFRTITFHSNRNRERSEYIHKNRTARSENPETGRTALGILTCPPKITSSHPTSKVCHEGN
jgi:hypothetical protein